MSQVSPALRVSCSAPGSRSPQPLGAREVGRSLRHHTPVSLSLRTGHGLQWGRGSPPLSSRPWGLTCPVHLAETSSTSY